jgi:cysteine synthase A
MGSVKDRLAIGVIEDAERRGVLKPGQTIIEATSGNTGIGLAMVCAQKGYPLVIVMADSFSVERRKLMRYLGAKVILTPAAEKGSGMVAKVEELAQKHGWWIPRQFDNPANTEIHIKTTAQEILNSFSETQLDYFVSGFGTGGTISGVSQGLKKGSPNTKIIVSEPKNSQMLASGISQTRNSNGTIKSHPEFNPHVVQGWAPDFVSKLAEDTANSNLIDEFIAIDPDHSLQCARDLATKEGLFVGISAGATLSAALEVAKTAPEGSNILCMLPDTGERYLSTVLFEGVSEEMNQEEQSILDSINGHVFNIPIKKAV